MKITTPKEHAMQLMEQKAKLEEELMQQMEVLRTVIYKYTTE